MQRSQHGITITGLLIVLVILVLVALLGMKLIPSYMEFRTAKNAIDAIARERNNASVTELRRAFEARATIDDVSSIKASDLEITKQGSDLVISFAYRKEVPLFANMGVYIDYAASTGE